MDTLASEDIFLFEGFRFNRRDGLSRRDEHGAFVPVAMGSRALDVLGALVKRAGDLVSRDEIISVVWPSTVVEDSNLNMQIAALRRVLDDRRREGSLIQTVSGRGYRFVARITPGEPHGPPSRTPPVAPRLSIVVLPFKNLSNDIDQQYFADGITEDVTTDLSRIADIIVISSNTALTYRNRPVDTKQIGRDLCVRYVLEGSVRRVDDRIRINAQLIDAETAAHLWAERFERDTGDLFALQDEITRRIAVALGIELVGAEAARPAEHPKALDYILQGRAVTMKPPSRASRTEAIGLFERALALEPQSVAAQSYLATALTARVLDNMTNTAAVDIGRAADLAGRALATSPRSPLAHYAKGQVLRAQHRYAEALAEYETVIVSDRNWVRTYGHIAQCKFYLGSIEETIPLTEHAIRLSPRDPVIGIWYLRIGQVHLVQSRTEAAVFWLEKARDAIPAHPNVRALLASAYALNGDSARAAAELAEARRLSGDDRFLSVARLRSGGYHGAPEIRALYETTYFAGLRDAGMPEQ